MKAITAIGIAGAFALLLLSVLMEGGNPMSFLNIPALLIVVGGTAGATIASTRASMMGTMVKAVKIAFSGATIDLRDTLERMVGLAERARRDGLLALEDDISELPDDFSQKGVQLIVDGADSELVKSILDAETDGMVARHAHVAKMFANAGGFAPTLGILGTVMSLVHVLENLDSPSSLGHSIAGAFIATLYGVGSANLIFLPLATKMKQRAHERTVAMTMITEGVASLADGDNPRNIEEKLRGMHHDAEAGEAHG